MSIFLIGHQKHKLYDTKLILQPKSRQSPQPQHQQSKATIPPRLRPRCERTCCQDAANVHALYMKLQLFSILHNSDNQL